ncbi:MAG: response regulator, partial [Nocardioidaceae bacterium]
MSTTVLVVEDDDGIAEPLVRTLEREGYAVVRVANGVDGVTRAGERAIDLVVLDLGLPDIDGIEVCRRIRDAGSAVPILILTARGGELD